MTIGLAAEMAEVDIERLGAGDGQEHRADDHGGNAAVCVIEELDAVEPD